MEYTELAAYPLPDGALTVWTPTCGEAAWRGDARAISHDHEALLADARSGAWIGSVMRVPVRYDQGAVRRALRAWIDRHEVLRSTVVRDGAGWRRKSVSADTVDVAARTVGNVSADEAHELISGFFGGVSALTWPHCLFATVEEPGEEAFVVAFGADHSVMDAYSQLLWFQEFMSLYTRALSGEPDSRLAALDVGSHVDHSAAARSLDAVIGEDDPTVRRWRDYLADGFPACAAVPSAPDADGQQHSLSRWVAGPDVAAEVERVCRGLGTGTQAGVLAAFGRAVAARTGDDRIRFVLPMHTRHDRRHVDAVGWYVGLCPVEFDLADATGFPEAVHIVRAGVSAVRACAKASFTRVAQLLGATGEPRFVVSYVDVRQVAGADRWTDWRARALRAPEPSRDEVYLWFIHSAHGINVSARCAPSDAAVAAVADLIAGFGDELARAARAPAAIEVCA